MVRDRLPSSAGDVPADLFTSGNPEDVFECLQEIGHGSFGAVFKGRDKRTGEIVAIKKMTVSKGRHSDEEWQEVFKEIAFIRSCDHESICRYKGAYIKGNTIWLAMEYCVGSATDIVEVFRTPLSEEEISAIVLEVLKALNYLHQGKKIHRDIKGHNVLLTEDGQVRVADFGSASMADPANTFIGTPYWMAPELIMAMETGTYENKIDIWSLGITCIELADRRPPLYDIHAMSALYHIPQNEPPKLATEGWSDTFKQFIALCLQKDPAKRPSAQELLQHNFIKMDKPPGILVNLVRRSQGLVSELDSQHYHDLQAMLRPDDDSYDGADLKAPTDHRNLSKDSSSEDLSINFGTLRPRSVMVGEKANEHDLLRSQLKELTRLKKKHQLQQDVLQRQHEQELLDAKVQNQKDLEALLKQQDAEMEKLRNKQRPELEAMLKFEAHEEKKELKALRDFQATEFKQYQDAQKTDLKEKHKVLLASTPKTDRKNVDKPTLGEEQAELNVKIREEQRLTLDKKMKKFKEILIKKRQAVEMECVVDETTMLKQHRQAQWDVKRQLQQALRDMRLQHLRKVHEAQESQQSTTQKLECDNMVEYHSKSEKDMRRRQYLESKARPKESKAIEQGLKRRFEELVKNERKSFKERCKRAAENTPKDEVDDQLRRLKKELMVTLQNLAVDFQRNLSESLDNSNTQFDLKIQEEVADMSCKHSDTQKSLKQFQQQRKDRSKLRHLAEEDELKRLLLLKQEELARQTHEDMDRLIKDSDSRVAELKAKHTLELEEHNAQYKVPDP
ncbi:serine/threonine-protein kinase 24 [Capsaspora owczarzaki ATCC 30864]|uniref:non-specific serine/threonine protein kinase n=1 Tax=Capsaspora owczarzaki (strain ATCC 30864) TaxID=595528 RepID=A0A0D2WHY3_CAPO3|nr:serine/threonine-protein kinase 24 [Capsaspora owczarzaki ATCC 30864]KJE88458.1 STE/STE20/TAO protein kinase [Capsaspora owczarzaki ATCC 30864]|eukprot:XP_004364983.2 serine/threonine-protein kinase 24 [Capsaspora owczarzaki ATCC 30864]